VKKPKKAKKPVLSQTNAARGEYPIIKKKNPEVRAGDEARHQKREACGRPDLRKKRKTFRHRGKG